MRNTQTPSTSRFRTIVLVLLVALAVILVADLRDAVGKNKDEPKVPKALDATAARKAQLDAQKQTNAKLDELIRLFKSGQVRVIVETKKSATSSKRGN